MPDLKSKRRYTTYPCGRCKGKILYLKTKGKPIVCPECGYGHGTRDVRDVPSTLRLGLKNLNQTQSGSRGITEQTTITSR